MLIFPRNVNHLLHNLLLIYFPMPNCPSVFTYNLDKMQN